MWRSPDYFKNPWQPFRNGVNKTGENTSTRIIDKSNISRITQTSSSGDENWNSVKETRETNEYLQDQGQYESQSHNEYRTCPESIIKQGDVKDSDCLERKTAVVDHNRKSVKNGHKPTFVDDFVIQVDTDIQPGWSQFRPDGNESSDHRTTDDDNQWSPFIDGFLDISGSRGEVKYEYQQRNDTDSYYSERSSYSTDTDDAPDDDYEIVEHVKEDFENTKDVSNENKTIDLNDNSTDGTSFAYDHSEQNIKGERFNTPHSSPCPYERYHTAPNSPSSDRDGFCIVDMPYVNEISQVKFEPAAKQTDANVSNNLDQQNNNDCLIHADDQHSCGARNNTLSLDSKHNDDKRKVTTETDGLTPLDTFTEAITACLQEAMKESKISDRDKQDIAKFRRYSQRNDRPKLPKMELPPFIDVENIQYEADPKTGAVRTVGKGSFGQVFKARFADPALRHVRIVVKEFNEEYTNRQEILEEAKRLLYLSETAYVPICYGLVYLGDVDNPTFGLVQEYVGSGLTLEQVLWDHYDIEIHLWLSIAFQACEGLARFHEKSILLNDIKSNNIILEFIRNIVRIRYIDFGLATDMRGKRYKNTKSLEDFVYLAPEVRKEGERTTIASDIFSLGYMLEQICSQADVQELGFMTRLCMDINPEARLPVRAAANIIYEHMVSFRYDTTSLCR